MSIPLYTRIKRELSRHVDRQVDESSRERLALLVTGIIGSQSSSPARIAQALFQLGLSEASTASIERRVRRIENDPEITAGLCFHRMAYYRLRLSNPQELHLAIDPTSQDERVVMLTVSVRYRGRSLPLAWAVWLANTPLTGERFWVRVAALLELVASLLPQRVRVIILGDRAFGTPAFTDLVTAHGWDYLVRVQDQTHYRDRRGREGTIGQLVTQAGQRRKLHGQVFKKRAWRSASVVVVWGKTHRSPLCLVTSLPPDWYIVRLYRDRYTIEAFFRDCKSGGWNWERNQVIDLAHTERLLVGMALATWLAVGVGTQVAAEYLALPPSPRRTRPPLAKYSLFTLGLQRLLAWWAGLQHLLLRFDLYDWEAPNWSAQVTTFHVRAFVFGASLPF